MFKKIIATGIAVGILSSSLFASGGNKPDELIHLYHPVQVIMPNLKKLKISKDQEERLNKDMLSVYPPKIQAHMKEIAKMEKEVQEAIYEKYMTKNQLKEKIDKVQKLKREVTDIHIDALNTLSDILNKKQFAQSLKMMEKQNLGNKKSNKFKIDELAILPHPGKLLKTAKIEATQEQKVRISKEVKAIFAPVFQDKMRKAFDLEKKLQRAVKKGKNKIELKKLLDEIAKLKREAMDGRIDALNHIQKIFTKEQWEKVNKLTYK